MVTYEWLADAILLYDQLRRKAPTKLYHPGQFRNDKEISALYRQKEPKSITKKKQADRAISCPSKKGDGKSTENGLKDPAVFGNGQLSKTAWNGRNDHGESNENEKLSCNEHNSKASSGGKRQMDGKPHGYITSDIVQIHEDPTDDFPFNVKICCTDRYGNPQGEGWFLRLFEQKASPKLYKFSPVQFAQGGSVLRHGRTSGIYQSKCLAMKEFEGFFARKTGIKWEERLLYAGERKRGSKYRYYAPAPGEPVGYIPSWYMRGHAKDTEIQDQNGHNPVSREARDHCSSKKRKRDDWAQLQPAKAAKSTGMTGAYDDVRFARASRL